MSASQDAAEDESARPLLALQVQPELPTHCYFLGNARRADVAGLAMIIGRFATGC
jgi:hypothetical protein